MVSLNPNTQESFQGKETFRDLIKYCEPLKRWFYFDEESGCWLHNPLAEDQFRMEELKSYLNLAGGDEKEITTKDIFKMAKYLMSGDDSDEMKGLLKYARKKYSIKHGALDSHEWLINCKNGVLDLETGDLKPHDRNYFMTNSVGVDYNQSATSPTWSKFLEEMTNGSPGLQSYLQRVAGYSITGSTKEKCLFLLTGKGLRARNIFCRTIYTILDDYSGSARAETFKVGHLQHDVLYSRAKLRSRRFLMANSTGTMNRHVMESLLSGDEIAGKLTDTKVFNYKPQFTLFFYSNKTPVITCETEEFREKLKIIPFDFDPPDNESDLELYKKLSQEAEGVFSWMARGCFAWQKNGLNRS